jgi:hypothetical protein
VKLDGVRVGAQVVAGAALNDEKLWTAETKFEVPADAPLSNPYWLDAPPTPGMFTVQGEDQNFIGLPERPSPIAVTFDLTIAGTKIAIARSVFYRWVDPVAGERHRSIEITPPVTAAPMGNLLLFANDQPKTLRVRLKAAVTTARGEVRLELPKGFSATPERQTIALDEIGAESEIAFQVKPPPGAAEAAARAIVEIGGAQLSRGLSRIEHAHIPIQTRFPLAEVKLARIDLKHARTRIGYVAGPGDEVPAALRQVGYDVTMLSDDALRDEPLQRFEAIVTGVRAFNTNARLPYLHEKLMAYVAAGGTLVVQYNTNNRISKIPQEIGPHPFQITQDRVTDEKATVARAKHEVFDTPNRITDADFAGWVQERGLYFAGTWDPKYETPMTMNDPGEKAKQGSLLLTRVGKGAFIYTGLAFFRQLPAGVPGAFCLFANLIDYGKQPAR